MTCSVIGMAVVQQDPWQVPLHSPLPKPFDLNPLSFDPGSNHTRELSSIDTIYTKRNSIPSTGMKVDWTNSQRGMRVGD
jgi:hypothetical protein